MSRSAEIPLMMPVALVHRIWYHSCREELRCCGEEGTMPSFRKLSAGEVAVLEQGVPSSRVQIAQAYDEHLAGFAAGDIGRVELHEGEQRSLVRRRLQAAARYRGWVLRFRSGPGPLTFCVEVRVAVNASAAPKDNDTVLVRPQAALAGSEITPTAPMTEGPSPRPSRRRQSATERYHEVLPRWMRTGQPRTDRAKHKR
jgi:hypothetical protein